jgi:hypothetical protein
MFCKIWHHVFRLIKEISQTFYRLPKYQGMNPTRLLRCSPETDDEDEMMLWPATVS